MQVKTKICTRINCRKEKLIGDFYKDKSKKDGYADVCKECSKARAAEYRNNPENKSSLKKAFKKYSLSKKGKLIRKKIIKKRSLIPKSFEQKLTHSVRCRIAQGLKIQSVIKIEKSIDLIGCSWLQLRTHLEKQFTEGMSWDNYGKGEGKWCVDHIKPIIVFNLVNEKERKLCFYYTNLQPLWYIENSVKGGSYVNS